MQVKVSRKCPKCGNEWSVIVESEDLAKFNSGKYLVQDCFPYLEPGDREFFITGICDDCFKKIFAFNEADI